MHKIKTENGIDDELQKQVPNSALPKNTSDIDIRLSHADPITPGLRLKVGNEAR